MPSISHIWIPRRDGRSAAIGLAMHSPCRPTVVAAQRLLWAITRVFGPAILPGRRTHWEDPVDIESWLGMTSEWQREFGLWDSVAMYRRPQLTRSGCALVLVRDGRAIGFVRVTTSSERARREFDVMLGVHSASPQTFKIARPMSWGSQGDWGWLATESVPNYPLAAVRRATDRVPVVREIGSILNTVLHRSTDTPQHWVGSHGDLAPWNLRFEQRRVVRVIDWEDASFAPPGADALYAAVTAALTFSDRVELAKVPPETITWVRSMIEARRSLDESPESTNNRLLAELDSLLRGANGESVDRV